MTGLLSYPQTRPKGFDEWLAYLCDRAASVDWPAIVIEILFGLLELL